GGLVIIDLDKCRDPQTGAIQPWAGLIVSEVDSYTEVSPSGTGLRIVARGRKPDRERSRNGPVEIYDGLTKDRKPGGRFLTFTGHRIEGGPAGVFERQAELMAVYERELKGKKGEKGNGLKRLVATRDLDPANDADLLDIARRAKNGA